MGALRGDTFLFAPLGAGGRGAPPPSLNTCSPQLDEECFVPKGSDQNLLQKVRPTISSLRLPSARVG